jgi:hypothetical protein
MNHGDFTEINGEWYYIIYLNGQHHLKRDNGPESEENTLITSGHYEYCKQELNNIILKDKENQF